MTVFLATSVLGSSVKAARPSFTRADLVQGSSHLLASGKPHLLSLALRTALAREAGVTLPELGHREVQEKLHLQLTQREPELAGATNESLISAVGLARRGELAEKRKDDLRDTNRAFGVHLLLHSDPAFQDPSYLAKLLASSNVPATGNYSRDNRLIDEFREAWKKLVPKAVDVPNWFTVTGSDANAAAYTLISDLWKSREHLLRKNFADRIDVDGTRYPESAAWRYQLKVPHLLVMTGSWVSWRPGPLSRLHSQSVDPDYSQPNFVTSPVVADFVEHDPKRLAKLEALENATLLDIERKSLDMELKISGLLIEPIIAAKGVWTYRPEFMARLRELCDRLMIPIIADEIFTGGGRTGKFFAFEHYPGFLPDYVTFGKGLVLAGVARVNRDFPLSVHASGGGTTILSQALPMIQATQILKAIHERDLVANARDVGAYLKSRYQEKIGPYVRGPGLLLYARGREAPAISLSREDVDRFIESSF